MEQHTVALWVSLLFLAVYDYISDYWAYFSSTFTIIKNIFRNWKMSLGREWHLHTALSSPVSILIPSFSRIFNVSPTLFLINIFQHLMLGTPIVTRSFLWKSMCRAFGFCHPNGTTSPSFHSWNLTQPNPSPLVSWNLPTFCTSHFRFSTPPPRSSISHPLIPHPQGSKTALKVWIWAYPRCRPSICSDSPTQRASAAWVPPLSPPPPCA